MTTTQDNDFISTFLKLSRLQRVIAYCLRFINNCRRSSKNLTPNLLLSPSELENALNICIQLSQIEVCRNSRSLTKLSDNPLEISYLTPGHFLIGEPLTAIPDPDLTVNRLNRWQRVQQMTQQIWQKWSADYLNSLQQCHKWATEQSNLKVSDIVVVKEDNLPPLRWKLAVVKETHPGSDKFVRVVTLHNNQGVYKRSINKLCKLPMSDNPQ
ncbi:uncharacterized protein LOC142325730 [Lycorma delicatula]|uniref:uncharacterized protein LOC142325730 n=1 Tax=Lycorma delicatula TaxID=130591 RepID=UPI003F51A902